MKAAVFFATREGQARKIADRIAVDLRTDGLEADVNDVRTVGTAFDWSPYAIACVAASVHAGHHEKEMIEFVRRYRGELERLGAVLVSVTLSEAGAEDRDAAVDQRARSAHDGRSARFCFLEHHRIEMLRPICQVVEMRDSTPYRGTKRVGTRNSGRSCRRR